MPRLTGAAESAQESTSGADSAAGNPYWSEWSKTPGFPALWSDIQLVAQKSERCETREGRVFVRDCADHATAWGIALWERSWDGARVITAHARRLGWDPDAEEERDRLRPLIKGYRTLRELPR